MAKEDPEAGSVLFRVLSEAEGRQGAGESALLVLEQLRMFAGGSVKRCKERNLDKAFQILAGTSKGMWELDGDTVLSLARCVVACQIEATGSSSTFCRLEKIVTKLAEGNESLVSKQVSEFMDYFSKDNEPLSRQTLQTVCIFIEESTMGRRYWTNKFMPVLRCIAATFDAILKDPSARNEEWQHLTVKICLQLFKWMPKEVSRLAWDGTDNTGVLQSILGSLLQIMVGKSAGKDTRLLVGIAVSMLVNTAPKPTQGARAVLSLYRLLDRGGGSIIHEAEGTMDNYEGECRFGMLSVVPSDWNPDGLETLVLTRGLLSCCKKEILSCRLDGPKQACLLLDVLFPVVLALMEEPMDHHYYCFQVFSLWLQSFRESLDEIWKAKGDRVLADTSSLLQRLVQLLWNNAESPVEGISESVRCSFQLLLESYSLECDHFEAQERPFYEELLQRTILMPWQARARYFALVSVLPYLGPEKVLDLYKDLPGHLLSCLSTNHLCPVAAEVYKSILQLQRKAWTEGQGHVSEEELSRKWARPWLPTLSAALMSSNAFLQNHASSHLLGCTLRLFPASSALLAESFCGGHASQLRAWVALVNAQKAVAGALPADAATLERLDSCLCSEEENIRLAALSLLCATPRTNQALTGTEIRLLKEFLLLNLNCDSSAFRQLLQASMKKALVRMRDSSLAILRDKASNKMSQSNLEVSKQPGEHRDASLIQAVDFVEWLMQLCLSSVTPGSNYQRRKTSLLLLAAVMETCTDTWSPERKKGQPPRDMAMLLNWARSKGRWDYFCQANTLMLLSCLQDGTNEIRELASELFVCYFPPAFPTSLAAAALFQRAQEAISSPRVQEAESGAVLMKTILQKLDVSALRQLFPTAEEELAEQGRCLCFLEHLFAVLQDHFAVARQNLLKAACTTPIHGVVLALRRCLLEVPEVLDSMRRLQVAPRWQTFLSGLVTTAKDINSFLLGVLQGKQSSSIDQSASAPSFADMGNAIGSLIQLGKEWGSLEALEEDSVLLSEEHSLILTCCWVSVKEIGLLLGGLAEKVLPLAPPGNGRQLLPLRVVHLAAEIFQDTLLKCRHWGAVEGCSMGFTKFCTALLRHPDQKLQAIPETMQTQGLTLLKNPKSRSITRRAAGFPMLFLCIVAGEDPTKSRPLLASCVKTLLALAAEPLPCNWDQTVDLPQVSAVHVLQTLARGSGLGTALHKYIAPMMTLLLKALGSPSWAMRNAAIQLFGSLTVRLLGQKRTREDSASQEGLSSEALFSSYPQLRNILLGELTSAASEGTQRGKLCLYPSLYAILTFLAKLQPSADVPNSGSICFLEPLTQLSGNPIYAVREMSARALLPLVPLRDYGKVLLQLSSHLPQPEDAQSHNALHGRLLQIQALLKRALRVNCLPSDALLTIACRMEDRLWLLTSLQRCPSVRTAYLQVVSLLMGNCSQSFAQRVWKIVSSELADSPFQEKGGNSPVQVGLAAFYQDGAHFLCQEAARLGCPKRVGQLCGFLRRGSVDVQVAILRWVNEQEERTGLDLGKGLQLTLLENLEEVLKGEADCVLLKLYLEAFVHLHGEPTFQNRPFPHKTLGAGYKKCMEILLSMVESDRLSPELLSQALCVLAFLLTLSEDHSIWERWAIVIEQCSKAVALEALRMAAAKSLKIAGGDLIRRAQLSSSSTLCSVALRLIDAGVALLQDGDHAVRHEAAVFASLLATPPQNSCVLLQANKALLSLLQLSLEKFGNEPETFAMLMHHLPTIPLSRALTELEAKGVVSLYKEDEPNVYAEPGILSQLLLPFLLQLHNRATNSPELQTAMYNWLKVAGPEIFSDLQRCRLWWHQDRDASLLLKALACPNVHIAASTLLARAALALCILDSAEERKVPGVDRIGLTSRELREEVLSVQEVLKAHGMVPAISATDSKRDT
ncbi:tRNA (32-2'-O)-methyltransferase regulator THADA isoform X2 [Anolis carolinensis]|uniref:tRNA (32-2'-O)-methyltransferase regulator THADA isoform X2 n=1 Tax=Anolis carolinensis TaxID=28377 RepID=UPI0004629193|nr:PREDICTED: thyroid adenoma-associated protein homolog isoform X2 [Anolis carolinensis]|eukprot:XP_008115552.1 PREDICTED: thyroid adenoma-associated protein homolog isoform X2 [Anolis carolinensis]